MQRNKNDKLDSGVICDFCATQQPEAWEPPSATQKELRSVERHRDDLQKMRTQTKNRLATAKEPKVRQSLQRLLDRLNEEMAEMDKQMETLVEETPTLKTHFDLLRSIISFGPRTALKLLAEMYDLAAYRSADAAAADAGVTPATYESGTTVRKKPKMSKVGKASVRGALFLPAMSAIRFNPLIQTFAERLRSKGKSEKVIIGAVMRKLMHLAYGVLKHQTPFDPHYRQPKPLAA
jgi:transposase